MNNYIFFLAIVLLLYFVFISSTIYRESMYVESDLDKIPYLIRSAQNKSRDYLKTSANTLAEINKRVNKLLIHLEKNYINDGSKNYFIKKLIENYHPNILSEAAIDNRYTTFTIDKKEMHICLRTRDENEKLYNIDLLMYVILHELSHLCNYNENENPIIGHGVEFKEIFKFLVIESIKLGIYKYKDYSQNPEPYCGIMLSSSILPNYTLY